MALYESVLIARQDITSAQVDALTETFSEIIKNHEGTVVKTENWGLRTLAYRMNKNRKGHYVLFQIDAPHAAVAEFERNLRLNEDVLRYLTLRVDAHEEGPSAVMQSKNDRGGYEGRPRRRDFEDDMEMMEDVGVA